MKIIGKNILISNGPMNIEKKPINPNDAKIELLKKKWSIIKNTDSLYGGKVVKKVFMKKWNLERIILEVINFS